MKVVYIHETLFLSMNLCNRFKRVTRFVVSTLSDGFIYFFFCQNEKERKEQTLQVHTLEFVADVRTQFARSQLATLIRRSATA
jgi:hypothetical protein